jgi:hypothetical protein
VSVPDFCQTFYLDIQHIQDTQHTQEDYMRLLDNYYNFKIKTTLLIY